LPLMRFRNSLIGQNHGCRFIHPDVLIVLSRAGITLCVLVV
jgi:hypothetical protein